MEMPPTCSECPMSNDYRECNLTAESFGEMDCVELRAEWCPLVELPPHGRLIDADAMIKQMTEEGWADGSGWADALDIALAPTIIEAEGE